jgi:GAF domain-containing protein
MTGRSEDVEAIGAMLAAEPSRDRALELLLTHARRLTRAEAGTVYVRDRRHLWFAVTQNEVLARRLGAEAAQRALTEEPLLLQERSIASYVALTRATVNVPDAYQIPLDRPYAFDRRVDDRLGYRTRSMLAMPLRDAHGRAWGVIQLINATNEAGDEAPFDTRSETLVASLVACVSHVAPDRREEPEDEP